MLSHAGPCTQGEGYGVAAGAKPLTRGLRILSYMRLLRNAARFLWLRFGRLAALLLHSLPVQLPPPNAKFDAHTLFAPLG